MTDIAELGLAIRSDGVVVAKDRLHAFNQMAVTADQRVAKLINTTRNLLVAFGVWKIGSALVHKFVDETIAAEAAQRRLETVIKSTGGAAGLSADELDRMAKALQRVTVYGDETIKGAQALLLTFTKIGREVFPQALESVLNVATAMGTDLQAAAVQVGKALNDPILGMTQLSRSGIQFSETQKQAVKAMIESGNQMGAQKIILKELETQFGGTARAARGTLGGALTALGEAFGDLFEANGPASEQLRQSVEQLIASISDPQFLANVQNLGVQMFNAFNGALGKIVEVISATLKFFQIANNYRNDPSLRGVHDQGTMENAKTYLAGRLNAKKYNQPMPAGFGDLGAFFGGFNADDIGGGPGSHNSLLQQTGLYNAPKAGPTKEQIEAAQKLADAYKQITDAADQSVDKINAQTEALGLNSLEAEKLVQFNTLLTQAEQAGLDITDAVIEKLHEKADAIAEAQMALDGSILNANNADPWTAMSKKIEDLNVMLEHGAISWNTYAAEAGKAVGVMTSSYAAGANDVLNNIQKLTDSLGLEGRKAFEVQKALSLARAVVSGGEAIVNSYNAGTAIGGPAIGAVFAGIAAAATAAQIASIASSSYQSKSVSNNTSAGASAAANQNSGPQRTINITLSGQRSDSVSLGDVEGLTDSIAQLINDGGGSTLINVLHSKTGT